MMSKPTDIDDDDVLRASFSIFDQSLWNALCLHVVTWVRLEACLCPSHSHRYDRARPFPQVSSLEPDKSGGRTSYLPKNRGKTFTLNVFFILIILMCIILLVQ